MSSLRIGVLVSGGGTTLQNFLDHEAAGTLDGKIVTVISSDPRAKANDRARTAGKPLHIIGHTKEIGTEAYSAKITHALDRESVDLVVMAGFLHLYRFPQDYLWRVMNIHPALLPSFGGRGMWGMRVHAAVVKSGVKVMGCTVHFADYAYDRGPIVLQKICPVYYEDTAVPVAERVFELEKRAYPEAVNLFARRKLRIHDGRVQILP